MQRRLTIFWWIEVVRGLLGLLFAMLLLTRFIQTIHDVLVIFGGYIILNSIGDVYRFATRMRTSRRAWIDYVLSGVSMLVGIACITQPYVTGILLAYLLLVRLLIHGVGELRAAWLHQGRLAGSEWLFGGMLILAVVCGLAVPRLTLALFFGIVVIYLIIDSITLLTRGLLFRFAPQILLNHAPPPTPQQADLPPTWPATTRRALVFVRHSGANGLGHIGWAFEWQNGWFNIGAVENLASKPVAPPATMDFWSWHTLDPIGGMQRQYHPYDEYKVFHVREPAPKLAWKTVVWESRTPYVLISHNCSDVVYDILRAYGVTVLADPAEQIIPNDWYAMLPGPSFPMQTFPAIPIHLHRLSQTPITMATVALTIPPTVPGSAPRWRARRAWAEAVALFDKMAGDIGSISTRQQRTIV